MRRTTGTALVLAATAVLALTGCDEARETAGNAFATATAAVASAAQQKMNEIKDGVNATKDVSAGPARADGDRTVADVTAANPKDEKADYTVLVTFRDAQGNFLDSVVLGIDGVPPHGSKTGTARSNRTLSGEIKADVSQALRH
ncbi:MULTISPECIES: hypothetical protein [unclassified Streptomyces]|uniref:hypothetical protein n=1 Tax=unclassified Streptomyces TaxID=2593676 RepID=UPI00166123C3|nr:MULTISPECIES: hypothetical protein [unclassified Streptomyces]MBD0708982.1 hypothetical protein [Streptomyces sp. CBMA291]MBD0716661.1 hypothetical protein [Streptomyces sp. CBMA370]